MKIQMKKLIHSKYFGLLLLILSLANSAIAQQYFPVVAKFTQRPPYPIYLSDFSNPNQTNLSIQMQMKDNQIASRPIRLKLYIEGQGFRIESTDLVQGELPITLALGQIYDLPNTQVANYFKQYNLKISPEQYRKAFSEGTFRFGVEVIDFAANRALSGIQWSTPVWIAVNEPPVWVNPANNLTQTPQQPQNVNFQWAPRHKNVGDVEYEFTITELFINEGFKGNVQNLFLSQPPYYKVRTRATSLNYNATLPPLLSGRTYAYRVQAIAKRGFEDVGVFRNNGYTEIQHFQYGEKLKPPTNLKLAWNDDAKSLTFNWKGQPEYKTFEVEYREKGTSGEWKKLSITPKNGLLNVENIAGLEAYRSYEFKLAGIDAQNQRASAEPITIEGIAKDIYLKKTEPEIKIEGKVQWAYYASEEGVTTNKKELILQSTGNNTSSTNRKRTSSTETIQKSNIGNTKYNLKDAIVSLYSGENSNFDVNSFKETANALKLIETVSTDENGKYVFKNKTLRLIRDLKNLYVFVKYKNEAFSSTLVKINLEENNNSTQTINPIVVLANTIRYSPVIEPEKVITQKSVVQMETVRYGFMFIKVPKTVNVNVEQDVLGGLSIDNLEEIGLYRLKSIVDKHPYLSNEGNSSSKTNIRYNNDIYTLVSQYNNTSTSTQIFYNKFYNDKFVLRVKQKGRKEVLYPVNPVENFEEGKLVKVTDYFKYKLPAATLKGYVVKKDLKNPVANATVQAFGTSLKTDKNGYYEFEIPNNVAGGTKINVSAKDPLNTYNEDTKTVEYQTNDIDQNLILRAEGVAIQGILVDASDKPVQGAKVIYNGKESTSNADGIFQVFEDGNTITGEINVVAEGFANKKLSTSDFLKIPLTESILENNQKEWVEASKNKSLLKWNAQYQKNDFNTVYNKEFRDLKRVASGIFENQKIVLDNPFKNIRIITYTAEDKRKFGMRNMKDSTAFTNVESLLSIADVNTTIPVSGYNTKTKETEFKVKVVNKENAISLYLEEEHTLKLPVLSLKRDSVYTFKIKLKPADYLYGIVMDSTVFVNGVDDANSKKPKRGEKLNVLKNAKVTFEGGSEATSDENGHFKILVAKETELSLEGSLETYNKSVNVIPANKVEEFLKPNNRKDIYLKEMGKDVPKFTHLLGFDVTVESAAKNSSTTFIISGKLNLKTGKAGDPKVNMLYKSSKTTELNFKDIVVMPEPAKKTNAIPVLSQINFVENEAELTLFDYAPITLEGNPIGEPFIRLQKLLGKVGEGKIGGSTLKFTKTHIMGVNFGEMELEEITPEKAKSFGKFNDKISEDKKTELKKDIKAVKSQNEKNEEAKNAEADAQKARAEYAAKMLEASKKAQKDTQYGGSEKQKQEAAAAVAKAKTENKEAQKAITEVTEVPEKEPLFLTFSTSFLEELRDNKEYQIVFKKAANKAKKGVDEKIDNTKNDVSTAKEKLTKLENTSPYFRVVGSVDKAKEAVSKAESAQKNAEFQKNKVSADENYIKFSVGSVSVGPLTGIFMNVEKNSAVLKKSGVSLKGVMSFPEIWKLKIDRPLIVEKIEVDKKFDLKQVSFALDRGYIYQQAVADSWMFNWTTFQIFNNFKGYGIGGKIFADKENFIHVKSLALSVVDGQVFPNIELDLPENGFRIRSLRFKTLGRRSISLKSNVAEKSYEFDGSLQIIKDDSSPTATDTDSTDKFGNKLSELETKMKTQNRLNAEEQAALKEAKKTTEQKAKEEADTKAKAEESKTKAEAAKKTGVEIFPLEVHRFTWSTTGKFAVAAKVGKFMVGGAGINIRRLVFSKGGKLRKSEIDDMLKLSDDDLAKLSSTTKFNDKQTAFKTDSAGTTSQTGALSAESQKLREGVGSGNLSVKAVEDKVAKEDPNVNWAFGFAGGLQFEGGPKSISFDSDVSLVIGDFGKGTEFQLNEIMLKLDAPAVRGFAKVKVSLTGPKIGMEGTGDIETAGYKFAASLKYYKYSTGEVEVGAAFQTSSTIPMGSITWTSVGGGLDLDFKNSKYKVFLIGSAINTGTSKKIAEYKNVTVAVEFDGKTCGAKPVIKGGMELWTKEEKFCQTSIELDFCKMRIIAKANCFKEIIEGSMAEINALVTISQDGFFTGATVRTEIIGMNVNGIFALGVECNTASPRMPAEISTYKMQLPNYLYKGDNVTFTGIYLGFSMAKEVNSEDKVSFAGLKLIGYKIKAEFIGKAYAGVNFTNGNFMMGVNSKLDMEGYLSILSFKLDGKLNLAIKAEGGKTSDMGWNFLAEAYGKLEIATGDHNNKGCNDYCVVCTRCKSNWKYKPTWTCSRYSNAYAKVCLEGKFGVAYRQKGYQSGWRSIKN